MFFKVSLFFLVFPLMISAFNCGFSPAVEFSPESEEFFKTARLIMTQEEKKIFKHLPNKESREEFIKDFWEKRDPNPDTEKNEFKEEFYERVEYANNRFKEGIPGWKTDRGRIYILFGFPDKIDNYPMLNSPEAKGYLLWVYYRYDFAVEFIDKRGNNSYELNPYSGIYGDFSQAMKEAKFGIAYSKEKLGSQYIDFEADYDQNENKLNISIPVKGIAFVEEEGLLKAEFEFQFFVYADKKKTQKKTFRETRHFEATDQELLDMKNINFTFSFGLKPGKYFFDVLIIGKPDIGKTRKIFKIKV